MRISHLMMVPDLSMDVSKKSWAVFFVYGSLISFFVIFLSFHGFHFKSSLTINDIIGQFVFFECRLAFQFGLIKHDWMIYTCMLDLDSFKRFVKLIEKEKKTVAQFTLVTIHLNSKQISMTKFSNSNFENRLDISIWMIS